MTHVLGMHNWVPVKRDQVSPDGTKYAFYEYCWIQVVWPRGENFRLSAPDDGQACGMYWSVLWTANDGVYVTPASVEAVGLWWVPFSGTAREVSTIGYWTASDGRYAYGSPLAPGSGPQTNANAILRLDLSNGSTTAVFWMPGKVAHAIGVDAAGNAVVVAHSAGNSGPSRVQVWLAGGNSTIKIFEKGANIWVGSVVADRMGTWISTEDGLYLYSKSAGMELASPEKNRQLASAFRAA